MNDTDSASNLAPISRADLASFFEAAQRPGSHVIGTEQEKFGLARRDGVLEPLRYAGEVQAVLQALMEDHGWQAGPDRGVAGEIVELRRNRASITLEPGGQIELSGAPLPTVHDTCAEFTKHWEEMDAVGKKLGFAFVTSGFHPFATREEIHWMPKGRYDVMRAYLPTKGDRALDMMTRTCTVQANLDYASEEQCGRRFRTALGTSAIFTAMFANSPLYEGSRNQVQSNRSSVWEFVDPDRCGIPPFAFDRPFSFEAYVDWALDVPMFFVKRGGEYHPHHVPFSQFMEEGWTHPCGDHHHATRADWELHLSTVFPEVRMKPFIEVRGVDSVGSRHVCALPALCKGILYDDDATDEAWSLVADLSQDARMDLWREAREAGLGSARVNAMAIRLLEIARPVLDRFDIRDSKGRTEARFLDGLEESVRAGRSPGDEALADIEGPLTRDTASKAFFYAGADLW